MEYNKIPRTEHPSRRANLRANDEYGIYGIYDSEDYEEDEFV